MNALIELPGVYSSRVAQNKVPAFCRRLADSPDHGDCLTIILSCRTYRRPASFPAEDRA